MKASFAINTLISYLYGTTDTAGSKAINYNILSPGIEEGVTALQSNDSEHIFMTLGAYLARIPLEMRMNKIEYIIDKKLYTPLHALLEYYYKRPNNIDHISQLMSQWLIIPGYNTENMLCNESIKQRMGHINAQLCTHPYYKKLLLKDSIQQVHHRDITAYNNLLRNIFNATPATKRNNTPSLHQTDM